MKTTPALPVCLLLLLVAKPLVAQAQNSHEPALPYSPSLDLTSMDKTMDPCVTLDHYACGRWKQQNPNPADQTSWSVYAKLYQDNLKFLRGILEKAAANTDP